MKWKHALGDGEFLFPVKEMAKVFRAKMVSELRSFTREKQITVPYGLFNSLFNKQWVVYAKQPFKGPEQVLSYLGRYNHRADVSNNRILQVNDKQVTFSWRDYRQNYKKQTTTLDGAHFLNLFCLHILPPGFTRIRHYGFLSSSVKSKYLKAIRLYFDLPEIQLTNKDWKSIVQGKMNINLHKCQCCGGQMILAGFLPDRFFHPVRAA